MKILDELDTLADGATPGPFVVIKKERMHRVYGQQTRYLVQKRGDINTEWYYSKSKSFPENAKLIARCDPQTIKALVAVVRAAKEISYEGHHTPCYSMLKYRECNCGKDDLDKALKRLEELS